MLTLTSPVETPFHRLPAGVKMAALTLFSIPLMAAKTMLPLGLAAGLVFALYLPGGREFLLQGGRALRGLWPFGLVLLVWGWWDDRLGQGALIALRLATLVAAANLVTMTTRLSEMLALFEWLARPFARILPPRRMALAFALVIRFIPEMAAAVSRLRDAWRARSRRGPGWRIIVPVMLAALDNADHAADALRARGGADAAPERPGAKAADPGKPG